MRERLLKNENNYYSRHYKKINDTYLMYSLAYILKLKARYANV